MILERSNLAQIHHYCHWLTTTKMWVTNYSRFKITFKFYHKVTVSNPHLLPSIRTIWDGHTLAVNSNDSSICLTNRTSTNFKIVKIFGLRCVPKYLPRYISIHFSGIDGSHGHRHWLRCRQPQTVIIVLSITANIANITEHKWHCREFQHT